MTNALPTPDNRIEAVRAWIAEHVGDGKRFRSIHAWMKAAGLSQGGLDSLKCGSIPRADTLNRLAYAVGENPLDVLIRIGFVDPSVLAGPEALTSWQRKINAVMADLPESQQDALIGIAISLREQHLPGNGGKGSSPRL